MFGSAYFTWKIFFLKFFRNYQKSREDEIELFTEPAPCYAIFMHWPICSGREIMWGCIRLVFINYFAVIGQPVRDELLLKPKKCHRNSNAGNQ